MNTHTVHYLTQEKLKELLSKVANERDRALTRRACDSLLYYSPIPIGLRASEVGLLRREDVDFDRLKILIQRLKGSISSEYPLRPEVAQALKTHSRTRKDNCPDPLSLEEGLACKPQVLGLPIATHLLDAGADIMFTKDWLGRGNIQNTIVYSQLTSRTRDEQARKVFASPRVV